MRSRLWLALLLLPLAALTALPSAGAGDKPGVALLSDDGWRRWFGADPRIVGEKILLNGEPLTVVDG